MIDILALAVCCIFASTKKMYCKTQELVERHHPSSGLKKKNWEELLQKQQEVFTESSLVRCVEGFADF